MSYSEKDHLTGFLNRDGFDETLAASTNGKEELVPVSVAFFDVDGFARINDQHGHDEGDRVLKTIAGVFSSEFPGEKVLFRIGGDEFAVILTQTDKEDAFLRLEAARVALNARADSAGLASGLSVSVGLATYPDDAGTRQEVVRKADDALYRAKSSGRNKVALAREEKKVPKTSHFTQGQLDRLASLSKSEGVGEAELLREALDDLLKKYAS